MSDHGKVMFTCGGCHKPSWRLLIDKHARVGINCIHCARVCLPASRCAAMIAERKAEMEPQMDTDEHGLTPEPEAA